MQAYWKRKENMGNKDFTADNEIRFDFLNHSLL